LDYIQAGLYDECVDVLGIAEKICGNISPMIYYYMGYALHMKRDVVLAKEIFNKASLSDPRYCFPNRLEAILALQKAIEVNPNDAKAYYYLGNLWYDKRQHADAISCWEKSVLIDSGFPTAKRNLALGYFNDLNRESEAIKLLEEAFELDTSDTRILFELDQLYKRTQRPHSERKAFLDKYRKQVDERDDLYLEYATLLNQLEAYQKAKAMVDSRKFHPWEGGEGKVPSQYQRARIELAKIALGEKNWDEAISLLTECYQYPHNLGEGKLHGAQENEINLWYAGALAGKGFDEDAEKYFRLASSGLSEPCDAIFYNDQKPDNIFYQGLALLKLEEKTEAERRFKHLIEYGEANMDKIVKIDYFAVSLPDLLIWADDLNKRNNIHCYYMMGLGYLGLEDSANAKKFLEKAAKLDVNHQGVQAHIKLLKNSKLIH
jgi:tetratricopeptide (TPR) repeat protein